MKILFVNNFDETHLIGGVENYLLQLTTFLKNNKKDIEFVWFGKSNQRTKINKKFFNKEITTEIIQIIDDFKPDLIHCFSIGAPVTPHFMKYAKQLKIPIIFSFRDYYYTNVKSAVYGVKSVFVFMKKTFHKKIINDNISFFVTPNNHLTEKIRESFNLKGVTLPNPLLIEDKAFNKNINVKDFILYVGRIIPEKGVQTLVKSFKIVLEKFPNQKLMIIGNGSLKTSLLTYINQNNLNNNITMIDHVNNEDLSCYYNNCKFTILPSEINESFGNVILESFYFNKTIICSDLVGLVDEINTNQLGLIFKNGSVKSLSDNMINLLENDQLRTDLEKNAANYVKKFSLSKHVDELFNIYSSFLNNDFND